MRPTPVYALFTPLGKFTSTLSPTVFVGKRESFRAFQIRVGERLHRRERERVAQTIFKFLFLIFEDVKMLD